MTEDASADEERERICRLPTQERLRYVEQIRVRYPRWNTILADIGKCHTLQPDAAEPPCLLLVGPSGAGKSTLTDSYAQQFPRVVTETSVYQPVLKATIPSPATVKNLLIILLDALGDPRADSGTVGGMTLRLERFLKDCGVQLLILDELQHFLDQDSQRVLETVSDWLKRLIKVTKVACVLIGLEGEANQVVNHNKQLARLFGDPVALAPFTWDDALPDTVRSFRTLLDHLERLLPLNAPSRLSDRDRAWRCFVASEGLLAHLMALLRQATRLALESGREALDDALLIEAFNRRLAGERRGIPNPFLGDLPELPAPTPKSASAGMPATNRRSKARKERTPTTKDVLSRRRGG